jgi:hypothetical protein
MPFDVLNLCKKRMGRPGNGGYNFLEKDLDKIEVIYGIGVG